ncbi:MAG TPA: hypothetical protein VNZ03_07345 [Terriglobales bacterium]|jgi:hypothetical protein|nr:hypothetical protein [Terriglobales bacterium]
MPEEKSEFQHNVFISWSGDRSKHVALALRDWLPMVLQAAKPFMSATDIVKGSRGLVELAGALEVVKVGIICLTPENLSAPWLLFESGALSKTLDKGTLVCTYLLAGLRQQDVPPPLGQFQSTKGDKEETRQMLQNINGSLGSTVSEKTLNGVFEALWPKLEHELSTMPKPATAAPPKRSLEDMVAEILELSRAGAKARNETDLQADIRRQLAAAFYGEAKPMGNLKDFLLWAKPDEQSFVVDPKGVVRVFQVKDKPKDQESKDTADDVGKKKK